MFLPFPRSAAGISRCKALNVGTGALDAGFTHQSCVKEGCPSAQGPWSSALGGSDGGASGFEPVYSMRGSRIRRITNSGCFSAQGPLSSALWGAHGGASVLRRHGLGSRQGAALHPPRNLRFLGFSFCCRVFGRGQVRARGLRRALPAPAQGDDPLWKPLLLRVYVSAETYRRSRAVTTTAWTPENPARQQ